MPATASNVNAGVCQKRPKLLVAPFWGQGQGAVSQTIMVLLETSSKETHSCS